MNFVARLPWSLSTLVVARRGNRPQAGSYLRNV